MTQPAADTNTVLSVEHVCKTFGGLRAVNDVSFEVRMGRISSVIGPNGAGKSTLFNMIAGTMPVGSGLVRFNGRNVTGLGSDRLARIGLARTFQNVRVLPGLTVRENILVGLTQFAKTGLRGVLLRTPGYRRQQRSFDERVSELLGLVEMGGDSEVPASSLPYGRRKVLELLMALAVEPELLLLDEPAAGLNQSEKGELGDVIRGVNARGVTVLLIEHDVRFVTSLADEVFVLNFGEVVASGPPGVVIKDPAVIEIYLGANE